MAICVIFGLVLIKKLLGGVISIARTILSGVMISVVKSLIAIFAFLVLYAPDGAFYSKHVERAKSESIEIINENTTLEEAEKEDKIVEAHSYIEGQFKPWGYSFSTILEGLITAFVISVLMAAFIAKNMMYQEQE